MFFGTNSWPWFFIELMTLIFPTQLTTFPVIAEKKKKKKNAEIAAIMAAL